VRYTLSDDSATASYAEFACTTQGGHLASLHSQADQDLVNDMLDDSVWIGYHDQHLEGCSRNSVCDHDCPALDTGFIWTDGTANDYVNWADGEPNDWYTSGVSDCTQAFETGTEDCTEMWRGGDDWNDADCAGSKPHVCGFFPDSVAGMVIDGCTYTLIPEEADFIKPSDRASLWEHPSRGAPGGRITNCPLSPHLDPTSPLFDGNQDDTVFDDITHRPWPLLLAHAQVLGRSALRQTTIDLQELVCSPGPTPKPSKTSDAHHLVEAYERGELASHPATQNKWRAALRFSAILLRVGVEFGIWRSQQINGKMPLITPPQISRTWPHLRTSFLKMIRDNLWVAQLQPS
jgi:hypothetical protein